MSLLYRHSLYRKANGLIRMGMVHLLSRPLSLYVVNEYPKSGGTWLGQMLGEALALPFPRNQLPTMGSSILHGHYLNPRGMKNVVVVWRDGRDVMVSWYYHCLVRKAPLRNEVGIERVREDLAFKDYDDVLANLPKFIEYSFTRQRSPRFSWADFVRRWHPRKDVVHVRYEDLHQDTAGELQRVVSKVSGRLLSSDRASSIADEFSFAQQSGRQIGEEDGQSFLRKGIVGDWMNYFSQEARETFDRYAGNELILLGYEKDRAWAGGKSESRK